MIQKIFTNQQCGSLSIERSAKSRTIHAININLSYKRSILDRNVCPLAYFDWMSTWEAAGKVIAEYRSELRREGLFDYLYQDVHSHIGSVADQNFYPYELFPNQSESDQVEVRAVSKFPIFRIFFDSDKSQYYELTNNGVSICCQYRYKNMTFSALIGSGLSVSWDCAKTMAEKIQHVIVKFIEEANNRHQFE